MSSAFTMQTTVAADGTPIPKLYICPLTKSLMRDPVITKCGHMFDRDAIDLYWLRQKRACPLCEVAIGDVTTLVACVSIKQAINDFINDHGLRSNDGGSSNDKLDSVNTKSWTMRNLFRHKASTPSIATAATTGSNASLSGGQSNRNASTSPIQQQNVGNSSGNLSTGSGVSNDAKHATIRRPINTKNVTKQAMKANQSNTSLQSLPQRPTSPTKSSGGNDAMSEKSQPSRYNGGQSNLSNHEQQRQMPKAAGPNDAKIHYGEPWAHLRPLLTRTWDAISLYDDDFVLGRSHTCDYLFTIPEISARHCQFSRRDRICYIEDLSTNGTFLNGRRIGKGQIVPVSRGDTISLGCGFSMKTMPDIASFLDWTSLNEDVDGAGREQLRQLNRATSFWRLLQIEGEFSLKEMGIYNADLRQLIYQAVCKWRDANRLPTYRFEFADEEPLPSPHNTHVVPMPAANPTPALLKMPVAQPRLQAPKAQAPPPAYEEPKVVESPISEQPEAELPQEAAPPAVPNEDAILSLMLDLFPDIDPAVVRRMIDEAVANEPIDWNDLVEYKSLQDNIALQLAVYTGVGSNYRPSPEAAPLPPPSRLNDPPKLEKALTSIAASLQELQEPVSRPAVPSEDTQAGAKEAHSILKTEVPRFCTAHAIEACYHLKTKNVLAAESTAGATFLPDVIPSHVAQFLARAVMAKCESGELAAGTFEGEPVYTLSDIKQLCDALFAQAYSEAERKNAKQPTNSVSAKGFRVGDIVVSSGECKGTCHIQQEDRHVIIDDFNVHADARHLPFQSFYAIFDGHGGNSVSAYVADHLPLSILAAAAKQQNDDLTTAIKTAYRNVDSAVLKTLRRDKHKGGSTALTVILRERELITAWVGHSRAVLYQTRGEGQGGLIAFPLTEPHLPVGSERQRIEQAGGFVTKMGGKDRVQGRLVVSRAFGNPSIKPWVPALPGTQRLTLNGTERFLVLGSDSFWDHFKVDEVGAYIAEYERKGENVAALAAELAKLTHARSNRDDVTVIVLTFVRNF